MVTHTQLKPYITIDIADDHQREEIYRLRHDIYARELGQHPTNPYDRICDHLDDANIYITAVVGGRVSGFISITPPENERAQTAGGYSIDKYFARDRLPVAMDETVYEVRLLSVVDHHRSTQLAGALMWAALRWIEARGGKHIIAIGRRAVISLYEKAGMQRTGLFVRSGAVEYEFLHATIDQLQENIRRFRPELNRISNVVNWRLDAPFQREASCYHGGAFFDEIGVNFQTLDRSKSIINADVLDAWFDPSPQVTNALRDYLAWLLKTSPPTNCEGFIETIAATRGLMPDNILPGAGSSDLIFRVLREWLTPQSRVLILDPMYGEYAHVLEQVIGCRVERMTLRQSNGY